MIIKIIEPIGESEDAIRARIGHLLDEGADGVFFCDTRGMTDAGRSEIEGFFVGARLRDRTP